MGGDLGRSNGKKCSRWHLMDGLMLQVLLGSSYNPARGLKERRGGNLRAGRRKGSSGWCSAASILITNGKTRVKRSILAILNI